MQGLPSILSIFCNVFNKFNNTGLYMSYDAKITSKSLRILSLYYKCNVFIDVI